MKYNNEVSQHYVLTKAKKTDNKRTSHIIYGVQRLSMRNGAALPRLAYSIH